MQSARVVGAGAFVLLGSALFATALFMIGERRMLFEERFTVYTEFARLGQLERGATVRVAGADAGEVTAIEIPRSPAEKFRVRMEVREDLHPLIRTDSVAGTQTEGLVGAVFVAIAAGSEEAPPVPDGGTIMGREPFQLADLMAQASDTVALINETVRSLRAEAENAVEQVARTAEDAHALIEAIRPDIMAIAAHGSQIASDTRSILASINSGTGTLGRLIHDDALYVQARQIADETRAVVENARAMTTEARRAIADLRSSEGPAEGLVADMRVTLAQAREATADLADNMEALKRNFLFRGFFNNRGYFDLDAISPDEYRNGVLENGRRKAMRIWLKDSVLFETGPEGTEGLTAEGRRRVDSAMSTFLEYLPSNPLVVEGYATKGTKAERFRLARRRAGLVRAHVLDRYGLSPRHTGSIALGDDARGSPGDGPWDGVAITLFLDRDELRFATPTGAVR